MHIKGNLVTIHRMLKKNLTLDKSLPGIIIIINLTHNSAITTILTH
jgi:hypothetical protein